MIFASRLAAVTLAATICWAVPAFAQMPPPLPPPQQVQPMPQPAPQPPPLERDPGPSVYRPEELTSADAVVLLTDHDAFDYDEIVSQAHYFFDCRHRLSGANVEAL